MDPTRLAETWLELMLTSVEAAVSEDDTEGGGGRLTDEVDVVKACSESAEGRSLGSDILELERRRCAEFEFTSFLPDRDRALPDLVTELERRIELPPCGRGCA